MIGWHTSTETFAEPSRSKITFENQYGTYSVETTQSAESISEVRDYLLIPVLLAAGYVEKTIHELFFEE
jgi:hypothetical protein